MLFIVFATSGCFLSKGKVSEEPEPRAPNFVAVKVCNGYFYDVNVYVARRNGGALIPIFHQITGIIGCEGKKISTSILDPNSGGITLVAIPTGASRHRPTCDIDFFNAGDLITWDIHPQQQRAATCRTWSPDQYEIK